MVGRAIFSDHTKKRPYHLNMMRVTVIDKPAAERVMVTHEGKEACCYVQGNAWDSPSYEDTFPGVEPYARRQPASLGQRSDQCNQ